MGCNMYTKLSISDKKGIHEVLFQGDFLKLDDDDKVESYYDKLPDDIKKDGEEWGFNDSVVMDNMHEWFENNIEDKSPCPKCGEETKAKFSGGIECTKCDYWECF